MLTPHDRHVNVAVRIDRPVEKRLVSALRVPLTPFDRGHIDEFNHFTR